MVVINELVVLLLSAVVAHSLESLLFVSANLSQCVRANPTSSMTTELPLITTIPILSLLPSGFSSTASSSTMFKKTYTCRQCFAGEDFHRYHPHRNHVVHPELFCCHSTARRRASPYTITSGQFLCSPCGDR